MESLLMKEYVVSVRMMNCKCGTRISKNADTRNRTQVRCARCCRLAREFNSKKAI